MLCDLVDTLGEFIFSLVTCGLSVLVEPVIVRVLMLINQGMERIGSPMGLLPLHFFYLMSPNPETLANERMLSKVLKSFSNNMIAEEDSRRRKAGLPFYNPSKKALARPAPLPEKLRVAFCGFDLLISAPTPSLIGRSLQDWDKDRYECWLVVRSAVKRGRTKKKCRKPALRDFDPNFGPGRELWTKFRGRILCIYADVTDEECAEEIWKLKFHVFFHINGYNYKNFYPSLLMIMDTTETMYIEMLSMASPLESKLLAHFTVTSPCLLNPNQLAYQGNLQDALTVKSEPFALTDLVYPVEGDQLDRQLLLGPLPAADGQPALVLSGGITRLSLEMQRLIANVLHTAPPGTLFWVQAEPEEKFMEIRETVQGLCTENGWTDHSSQIVCYPYNHSKDRHIDVLSRRRDSGCPPAMARARLIGIGTFPCNQHTGAGDGMLACIPTVGLVGHAWPGRVVAGMNWFVGMGELLNASSMQELASKLLHLIFNPWLIDALSQHMWGEMKARRSFYNPDRIKVCMQNIVHFGLEQVRSSLGDRGKLSNIDLTDPKNHSPRFVPPAVPCPSLSSCLAASPESEVERMLALIDLRRFEGQRTALVKGLRHHQLFLTYDRVSGEGATRVTFAGRVRMEALSARVIERYGLKEGAEIALKAEHIFSRSSALKFLSGSCNIHEAQVLNMIEKRLARKEKRLIRFTRLLPLWGDGNAAVSLVPCNNGAICFLLCQAVKEDLLGSATLKNGREAWCSRGEVSEALHTIARSSLHAFYLLHKEAGYALMDPSYSNMHLVTCNTAGLDPDIRARMPQWCGFLDLGSAVDIGTSRQRMNGDARLQSVSPADEMFTLPEPEAKGPQRGLVFLSSLHLEDHAGHVRQRQTGLGKTSCWTRGFSDDSLIRNQSPLTVDTCISIDSFGCAAMIYQMFCPRRQAMDHDTYVTEMKTAAGSPEAMLYTMKSYTTATIQQPRAAQEFANLLWGMMRGNNRLSLLDALLHPSISIPVLTPCQSLSLNAGFPLPFPGGRGPMGSPWEHMGVPGWERRQDGCRGLGLFATQRLEYRQLAGLYVGLDCEATEFPPGRSNVSLMHNPDGKSPASFAIGELPLSVLEEKCGAGVYFNAGDKQAANNLSLDRRAVWRDGKGLAYIPLYVKAEKGIEAGEGGYWRYAPFFGIGGADSYTFQDAKYGLNYV